MTGALTFAGGRVSLIHGDCREVMKYIAPQSVDLVLTDLPYGTTYAKWDEVLPMGELWSLFDNLSKPKAAHVFTASQPFTSLLVNSRPEWFRTSWVWDKVHAANFANANRHPMKVHEDVLVFASGQTTYNPQKTPGRPNNSHGNTHTRKSDTMRIDRRGEFDGTGMKYPKSIQTFEKHTSSLGLHPTQKPVPLFEYFIRTYSDPGAMVLDPCAGSGTTAEAAMRTDRRAICIEQDAHYFGIAAKRLQAVEEELSQ